MTDSWAQAITDHPANNENDIEMKPFKGRAPSGSFNGGVPPMLNRSLSASDPSKRLDPAFFYLLAATVPIGLIITPMVFNIDAGNVLALVVAYTSSGEDQEKTDQVEVLLRLIVSGLAAVVFALASISFFYHESKIASRAVDDLDGKLFARASKHGPSGLRAKHYMPRGGAFQSAVGLFVSHLYFQLPGGPAKRFFFETFQWASDLMHGYGLFAVLGPWLLPFILAVTGLAAFASVWGGWCIGKCLHGCRRSHWLFDRDPEARARSSWAKNLGAELM